MNRPHLIAMAAATLASLAVLTPAQAAEQPPEPEMASYALDIEAKVLSDRRTNGLSDTYLGPGAELTFNYAHESGLIGYLQLGNVAKESFPDGGATAVAAVGYRWGNPSGWHFGVGLAQEMFPGAKVNDAPRQPFVDPTDTVNTRFDTTFGVLEFGYGIIEARYLLVASKDFRGNNTAVVCGSAAAVPDAPTRIASGLAAITASVPTFGLISCCAPSRVLPPHKRIAEDTRCWSLSVISG